MALPAAGPTIARVVVGTGPESEGIRVVVADRHPLVRRALHELIDVEPGFSVVAQAPDVPGVDRELRVHRPDLLLLEPELLGGDGLARLPTLLVPSPATRAIMLADGPSTALERHATDHGAAGVVVKHAAPDELFAILRRVASGLGGFTPRIAGG